MSSSVILNHAVIVKNTGSVHVRDASNHLTHITSCQHAGNQTQHTVSA